MQKNKQKVFRHQRADKNHSAVHSLPNHRTRMRNLSLCVRNLRTKKLTLFPYKRNPFHPLMNAQSQAHTARMKRFSFCVRNLKKTQKFKLGRHNNKGQAMMELIAFTPIIWGCIIFSLLFFHLRAQYLWIDHNLYQALICLSKGHEEDKCTGIMLKKISEFLWTGELTNINFSQYYNGEWIGTFNWETKFWYYHEKKPWSIPFKKKLNLESTLEKPLLAGILEKLNLENILSEEKNIKDNVLEEIKSVKTILEVLSPAERRRENIDIEGLLRRDPH